MQKDTFNSFKIQLVLIIDENSSTKMNPLGFNKETYNFIKSLPKDITQVKISELLFKYLTIHNILSGIEIKLLKSEELSRNDLMSIAQNRVSVFIAKKYDDKFDIIDSESTFLYVEDSDSIPEFQGSIINSENIYYSFIILNHKFQIQYDEQMFNNRQGKSTFFKNIEPLKNNFYMWNQIFGSLWVSNYSEEECEDDEKFGVLLSSVSDFDYLVEALPEIRYPNKFMSLSKYKSLIITLPSYNPVEKKISKKKGNKTIKYSEQDINFNFIGEQQNHEVEKINYLDFVGYLHSSFMYSPCIRLPKVGQSISTEYSYLFKKSSNYADDVIFKDVQKFGKKLMLKTITEDFKEYLINRDGQIVVISDIPFELLHLDNIPITYTHDVCRIPETTPELILKQHQNFEQNPYIVPRDILSKTLIISDQNEARFEWLRGYLDEKMPKLGFTLKRCKSVCDVENAVKLHKPDFLIFDCHGDVDDEKHEAYLKIGEERLTAKEIRERKISAPLVFLSSCLTAPIYNYQNNLVNAFFELNAYSVTATFFPINIMKGGLIIGRILKNLDNCAQNPIHINWLNFISHTIRLSILSDLTVENIYRDKIKNVNHDKIKTEQQLLEISKGLFYFENRRNVINNIKNYVKNFPNYEKKDLKDLQASYYTNLGRSDLIQFKSNTLLKEKIHEDANPF